FSKVLYRKFNIERQRFNELTRYPYRYTQEVKQIRIKLRIFLTRVLISFEQLFRYFTSVDATTVGLEIFFAPINIGTIVTVSEKNNAILMSSIGFSHSPLVYHCLFYDFGIDFEEL